MSIQLEILQQYENEEATSIVACVNGSICAGEVRIVHTTGSAYLDRIYVKPEFRGFHIGEALLQSAESWAKTRKAPSVSVVFSPSERGDIVRLARFFENQGYQVSNLFSAVKRF